MRPGNSRANRRSLAEHSRFRPRRARERAGREEYGARETRASFLHDLGRKRLEEPFVPPAVARHDEHRALAEDVGGEEAHHGEESLVVGADERVVEEKRHPRRARAEIAKSREARRQVKLLARAGREAGPDLGPSSRRVPRARAPRARDRRRTRALRTASARWRGSRARRFASRGESRRTRTTPPPPEWRARGRARPERGPRGRGTPRRSRDPPRRRAPSRRLRGRHPRARARPRRARSRRPPSPCGRHRPARRAASGVSGSASASGSTPRREESRAAFFVETGESRREIRLLPLARALAPRRKLVLEKPSEARGLAAPGLHGEETLGQRERTEERPSGPPRPEAAFRSRSDPLPPGRDAPSRARELPRASGPPASRGRDRRGGRARVRPPREWEALREAREARDAAEGPLRATEGALSRRRGAPSRRRAAAAAPRRRARGGAP